MVRWSYVAINVPPEEVQKWLNKYGEQGWENYHVEYLGGTPYNPRRCDVYFKRPGPPVDPSNKELP
jgi:hypothetical protein